MIEKEDYTIKQQKDYLLVTVFAENLDSDNSPSLKNDIADELNAGEERNIIIDLTSCKFCDGNGVGALLAANRLCKNKEGKCILYGLQDAVMRLVDVLKIEAFFNVSDTLREAEVLLQSEFDVSVEIRSDVFEISRALKTPYVRLDANKGTVLIEGGIIPEDCHSFFRPILEYIDWKFSKHKTVLLQIKLVFFNTMASKYLLEIFRKFNNLYHIGADITCQWHYESEDEEMMEMGEDYKQLVDYPFEFIEVKES